MKPGLPLSGAGLVISFLIAPQIAQAQDAAQKMFFEGDMVAGDASSGPVCVLNNQYKQGQTVLWRVRVLDQTGKQLDAKDVRNLEVDLPGGQMFAMRYGPQRQHLSAEFVGGACGSSNASASRRDPSLINPAERSYLTWASSFSNRSLFMTNFADSALAALFASSRLTGMPTWMTPTIPIILCAAHA